MLQLMTEQACAIDIIDMLWEGTLLVMNIRIVNCSINKGVSRLKVMCQIFFTVYGELIASYNGY